MKNYRLHPALPRFFALIIDLIILSISCSFLAKFFANHLAAYPFVLCLIGSAYCLIYFAMFNSTIGSGKTSGKMLCKIRISNSSSQDIGIAHSFLRSAIFILPLCFIGYLQPYAQFSFGWTIIQVLLLTIVIGCLYLAAFNTNSNQSLHDWLADTLPSLKKQPNLS